MGHLKTSLSSSVTWSLVVLQAAGTAPGITVTSAGRTPWLSANCVQTPSARLTRRGCCVPGPPRDSCAARSTMSLRGRTTRPRPSALRRTPPPLVPKAPGKPRPKTRAPRGKRPRPDGTFQNQTRLWPHQPHHETEALSSGLLPLFYFYIFIFSLLFDDPWWDQWVGNQSNCVFF